MWFRTVRGYGAADAELERLLKETGKQLSLPHDYVQFTSFVESILFTVNEILWLHLKICGIV
uniref:Uncharacterized protein n=1 Tax=Helianthus annuus TaxID=4232 RepID=A0A251SN35_HELAN